MNDEAEKSLPELPDPDWSIEQVAKVARTLYAIEPFEVNTSENIRWNMLVQKAFTFLENLHEAYKQIAAQRKEAGPASAAVNEWLAVSADAKLRVSSEKEAKLPVPFEKAARFITREATTDGALPKLKKVLHCQARQEGHDDAWIENTLEAKFVYWREHGIPRTEVLTLRGAYERWWDSIVAEQDRAKKVKQ
jgi:hypothetical protein